jgi:adenylate kinase
VELKLIIVLLGPPGSGKGTYASILTKKLNIPHISTGDLVREEIKAGTKLGKEAAEYVNRGELIPDEKILEILKNRVSKQDCVKGFILDGYPRTLKQAEDLNKAAEVDVAVNLNVPDEVIIERLAYRLTCRKCGAIYNEKTLKPKKPGVCDKCGGQLYKREDDEPEVIKERLRVYKEKTQPLIDFYKNKGFLVEVKTEKADASPEEIASSILKLINEKIKG